MAMFSKEQLRKLQQERKRRHLGLSSEFFEIERIKELSGIAKETCDIWEHTTGIEKYQDVLNEVESRELLNLKGEIVYMNPEEFIAKCDQLSEGFSSYADSILEEDIDYSIYLGESYKKEMEKGVLFPIPYLDLVNKKGTENKALAWGAKLFGCPKIPVAIFTSNEK